MGMRWDDQEPPSWRPEPLANWVCALLGFAVGFALAYLVFVP